MDWVRHDLDKHLEQAHPVLDELVLYLDTSVSMQGYVRPRGSEFSQVLGRLDDFAENLKPSHGISFRTVGSEVEEADDRVQRLIELSRTTARFAEEESAIADAIRSFDETFRLERNERAGVPRCHVLVTDGVQYTSSSSVSECQGGNAPECVNEEIRALITKGWGVHVFAIRSRFHGKVWQHSRSVRGDRVPHETHVAPAGQFEAYRPFLVLLFTSEVKYIGYLADAMRRDLGQLGLQAEIVREIPLTAPLLEATEVDVHTDYERFYSVDDVDAGLPGEPNPLLELASRDDREDRTTGKQLPDWVRLIRYEYEDPYDVFSLPFAFGVSARVELTEAGTAWLGHDAVAGTSIMKSLSVTDLPRPDWIVRPNADAATGGDEEPDEVDEDPPQPKVLDFLIKGTSLVATEKLPADIRFVVGEKAEPDAEFQHLPMRWSESRDYLPLKLLRVDGDLDPSRIALPAWVDEWSTNSDSSSESFNRILNLDLLFRRLQVNGPLERQGMNSIYILIEPRMVVRGGGSR